MHRYCALQAVEPNSESFSVLFEEHLGHSTFTLPNRPILDDALTGGVIPNFLSFSRPTSLIQSVVHGGDNIRFMFGLKPTFKSSVSIAISIAKTAGHPEYVVGKHIL